MDARRDVLGERRGKIDGVLPQARSCARYMTSCSMGMSPKPCNVHRELQVVAHLDLSSRCHLISSQQHAPR
jgi:hypothetical protein